MTFYLDGVTDPLSVDEFDIFFAGKTQLGQYIPTDFYDNCVGNRACLFASKDDEIGNGGLSLSNECCHWIPQLNNGTPEPTRSGKIKSEELCAYVNKNCDSTKPYFPELYKVSNGGIKKGQCTREPSVSPQPLSPSSSQDTIIPTEYNWVETTDDMRKEAKTLHIQKKRSQRFEFRCPYLRMTRSPLFWTLRWVRGVLKSSKTDRYKCVCKCWNKVNTFTCINPWHYKL